MTEADRLRSYLTEPPVIAGSDGEFPELPWHRAIVRQLLPERVAPRLREIGTDAVRPLQRRAAARLRHVEPLRIHIGSGRLPKEGWVNIDLLGASVDVAWNVRRGLPFAEGSAEAIFHEHVLEHFTLADGHALIRECCRVLRPGGCLRVGVPDAGAYMRSYAGDGAFLEDIRPGRPTRLLAVSEIVYWYGHRAIYDFETLAFLCHAAGFASVERRSPGEGELRPNPDSWHHRLDTLYVEAFK